jgi:hypothetical protein
MTHAARAVQAARQVECPLNLLQARSVAVVRIRSSNRPSM